MNAFPEIPGHRIERRIGEGGMATVYLATQLSLDRPVAIKVVHFRGAAHEQLAVRFEHEARTIASLEHPNIVGIHEVGRTSGGLPYYSMAYLPNGDLTHARLSGQLDRIGPVLRMIAQALGFAHAHGVVHRDVKPDNVLFDREHRARLADFGISRSIGFARVTNQGDALGSSAYMSPEQARGQEVDARSDLYSLGVMAYELLTGTLPFHGDDMVAMAMAHHSQPIPRLPEELARWQPLIDKALAKRVADRVQNADEFIAILDHITEPSRLQLTGASSGYTPAIARPPKRKIARLVALAALLLITSVGAWRYTPMSLAADDPEANAAMPAVAALAPGPAATVTSDATLTAIADRIAARHWFEPAQGSASALLGDALGAQRNDEYLDAADIFVAKVGAAANDALRDSVDVKAIKWVAALRTFAQAQNLRERAAYLQFEQALAATLADRMLAAEQLRDPSAALLLERLFVADAALSKRWMRLAASRQVGASLRDANGPPMRLIHDGGGWFAIAEFEVTRDEYGRFATATGREAALCRAAGGISFLQRTRNWREPGFVQTGQHPVVCVSHDDARAYTDWLSRRTGNRYRLPTASEWRTVAAGVGRHPAICTEGNILGADSNDGSRRTRYPCRDGASDTATVGRYAASTEGVHDLIGNVAEWVGVCVSGSACSGRMAMGSSNRDGRDASLLGTQPIDGGKAASLDVGFRVVRELN